MTDICRRARARALVRLSGRLAGAVALIGAFAVVGPVAAAAASPASTAVVVADTGSNSITEYAPGANGNAAPIADIAGPATGLNNVYYAVFAPNGDVAGLNHTGNSVTFYSPGSTGNVAPAATLAGSNTGLNAPTALGYDGSGHLFVLNAGSGASITEYAAGATGNATPIATISGSNTGLTTAALTGDGGLDVLPNGAVLVADGFANTVLGFSAGANGNVAPAAEIGGSNTGLSGGVSGVGVDSADNIYVTDSNNSVAEFAAGASGNIAPIKTISGSNTGLNGPSDPFIDPGTGDIIVSNYLGNSITEYSPGSNGNVAPIATIAGPASELNGPDSVAYTVGLGTRIGAVALVQVGPGLSLLTFSAQLTQSAGTHAPLAGQTLVFSDSLSGVLCTATTNSVGVASCPISLASALSGILSLGYTVRFAGNTPYLPSSATGSLLSLLGLNLL